MSVSSLATSVSLSSPAPTTATNPAVTGDVQAKAPGNAVAKTPFAHILARGKTSEKDHQASPKRGDADDGEQQPATDSLTSVAIDEPAVPADLSTAADQGISAVLALLASTQAVPAPPPILAANTADSAAASTAITVTAGAAAAPITATVPSVAIASIAAIPAAVATGTAVAIAADMPAPVATPTAQPARPPLPLDIANLSPTDQQLLRSMIAAFSAKKAPVTGEAAAADIPVAKEPAAKAPLAEVIVAPPSPSTTTVTMPATPNISEMAAALQRAFGRVGDKISPKASQPSGGVAALAPPASGPAITITDPALKVVAPKHAGEAEDRTTPVAGIVSPASDVAVPAFAPTTDGTSTSAAADVPTSTTGIAQPSHAEQSVTRHLDMLRDTQWLDNLAHDISQAASQNGHLKFQINPEHLGSLAIEITHGEAGASIRMTTDNDHARAIIADAQPRLIAEVRAQGLRVADSHVDLGHQASGGGNANHRSSSEDHKPFVRTQVGTIEEVSDSPPRDDELYA